jgi:hypothetical protein
MCMSFNHDNKLLKIKSKQAYTTYFKFLP